MSTTPLYHWLIQLPEPLWLLLLLVVTLIIFFYLDAVRMLRRQAFLAFVYASAGKIRRWLWDSLILRIGYVFIAMIMALLAIIVMAHLHWLEWLVFACGMLSLGIFYRLFSRGLRAEAQPEFLAVVALRLSAWCNLAVMVIALALVQFFWLDLPDTRAFAVSEYMTYAWQQYDLEHASVPVFAILLAVAGTLQDVQWYLLQQVSGVALPVTMKIAAWLVVLMIQATKLGVLQLVILGLVSIVTASSGANRQVLRKRLWRRSVLLPIALVFVSYLALTKMPQLWSAASEKGANEVSSASANSNGEPSDPCDRIWANNGAGAGTDVQGKTRRQAELASLESSLSAALQTDHAQAQARLQRDIEMQVAAAYAQAEAGVDAFLDWNFSLAGQYAQLIYLAGASVSQASFADYLSGKMNGFIREPLTPALLAAQQHFNGNMEVEVQRAGQAYQRLFNQFAAQTACLQLPDFDFDPSQYVDKSLVGLGAGAALAARIALAAGTRTATHSGVRRAISAIFTRGVARAGAVTSGGAGAVCGPWAIVCTPAIIATVWLSTDYGLNKADEALNRESMKAEMMAALADEQAETVATLYAFYARILDQFYAELDEHQNRQFNILRDGVR